MARRLIIIAFLVWILPLASARAELYIYEDKDGVIHFTNVPKSGFTKHVLPGTANTYEWKDNLGVLRKVHRADITTFDETIREAAAYYELPPALVKAVVAVESSFEPTAVSPAGAQGLMQLIPATAAEMRVGDVFNPRDNIYGGARYLRILANNFGGDLRKTIAGYNAGPQAVERYGGVPSYEETRKYVSRVLYLFRYYTQQGI